MKVGLAALAVLALAIPASAQTHHPHARRTGARHHRRAHRAIVNRCEEVNGPEEIGWPQWRIEMHEAGFTPTETMALEACGEE